MSDNLDICSVHRRLPPNSASVFFSFVDVFVVFLRSGFLATGVMSYTLASEVLYHSPISASLVTFFCRKIPVSS